MANILTFNMDLIFPAIKLELDLLPMETIAILQIDLLSTGSISTFRTTATIATRANKRARNTTKPNRLLMPQPLTLTQYLVQSPSLRMTSVYFLSI